MKLLILFLFIFCVSCSAEKRLSMSQMKSLESKDLTLYDGFIMKKEDARFLKEEKLKPFKRMVEIVENDIGSKNDKEFLKRSSSIIEEVKSDRVLTDKHKNQIIEIIDFRKKLIAWERKFNK